MIAIPAHYHNLFDSDSPFRTMPTVAELAKTTQIQAHLTTTPAAQPAAAGTPERHAFSSLLGRKCITVMPFVPNMLLVSRLMTSLTARSGLVLVPSLACSGHLFAACPLHPQHHPSQHPLLEVHHPSIKLQ